jgi:integrase
MQMTDISLKRLNKAGRHTDDQTKGLHLWVKPSMQMYWIFRYTINGKREALSFGAYPEIGLRMARKRATEARNKINQGVCPLSEKKAAQAPIKESKSPIFSDFALSYIETMRPKWRCEKHAHQWVSTIKTYAFPILGDMRLEEIDTADIQAVLMPIWLQKPETAARVRGRMEKILSAAITHKYRATSNPAVWKGHLENLFPAHQDAQKHHEALPYDQLTDFMQTLKEIDGISALALQFTILNASRTGEVLLGLRSEVKGDIWTIPASRMKAKQEHQVPLCSRSLELLEIAKSLDPDSAYLFSNNGKPLSNMAMLMMARRLKTGLTVHGFRSTFRDWVSEETEHSPEVAEMALAHTISNKVEAAYRRGKLLDRRRVLMKDWETYCLTGTWGNVVKLRLNVA